MAEPTRRSWTSPELTVLVRSGPEETVLSACKTASSSGESANNDFGVCIDQVVLCGDCHGLATS